MKKIFLLTILMFSLSFSLFADTRNMDSVFGIPFASSYDSAAKLLETKGWHFYNETTDTIESYLPEVKQYVFKSEGNQTLIDGNPIYITLLFFRDKLYEIQIQFDVIKDRENSKINRQAYNNVLKALIKEYNLKKADSMNKEWSYYKDSAENTLGLREKKVNKTYSVFHIVIDYKTLQKDLFKLYNDNNEKYQTRPVEAPVEPSDTVLDEKSATSEDEVIISE